MVYAKGSPDEPKILTNLEDHFADIREADIVLEADAVSLDVGRLRYHEIQVMLEEVPKKLVYESGECLDLTGLVVLTKDPRK